MGRSVTTRTVAEMAGVSAKTVSNVINGTGSFSPETEHRVRAAVEELGYQINPFARGLRSRRTCTIGLVLPNVHQPFNAELAEQVIRAASETGGPKVVVETTCGSADRERTALSTSYQELVDGINTCRTPSLPRNTCRCPSPSPRSSSASAPPTRPGTSWTTSRSARNRARTRPSPTS
ncbi:LacI family DNA-binding transcriptional regulator [Streptomyces canus]|uniref:LacI family DNA-binding transcriptional regulator n=1 Tax=Streptomyces canus TaxID=58343 RepID=UPI00099EBD18